MGREFLPRTEPFPKTKLYAKCLSLTIVVLVELYKLNTLIQGIYIYIYILYTHIQDHIYLDTDTIFIILVVDQNIFKLQLYNEYGLKAHTLSFNLRVLSSKLEERLRNYGSLICTSPLFQGTISNWTVDSKAISWTDVDYSFVIST